MAPAGVFISAFLMSAFAGLACLLRSGVKIRWLNTTSSLLNSGFLGLGISLLWYTKFQDNVYFLLGVCVMAGLGGMAMVELALALFRKNGFTIKFGERDKSDDK